MKRRILDAESVDQNAADTIYILNEQGRLEEEEVARMEPEYTPTEPQTDQVYILDGRGKMVKVEVEDDASDD